jgi:hypothetical protein
MEDAKLLAQHPSDDQQRFNQKRQGGKVLAQFLDAGLEPYLAAGAIAACRRSDRMRWWMSAIGTKLTLICAAPMSAFGGKADMTFVANSRLIAAKIGN